MSEEMQRLLDQKKDAIERKRLFGSDLYCDLSADNICDGLFLFAKSYIIGYDSIGNLSTYYNLAGKISNINYDKVTDKYNYTFSTLDSGVFDFSHSSLLMFSTYSIDVLETRKSLITDFLS